jgi:GNAT superfamily N-acetyltransferase
MRIIARRFTDLTPSEIVQLRELTRQVGAMRGDLEYGRRPTTKSTFVAVMAKERGVILGWWSLHAPVHPTTIFVNAFVRPEARGRGLGAKLGQRALAESSQRWPRAGWIATAYDDAGVRLYQHLGFRPTGDGRLAATP